jgi:hypothetical protein
MHQLLFVYGILQDPALLTLVLGRALDPRNVLTAVAPGHRAVCLPGRTYPGLRQTPGAAASGQLLLGLSRFELQLLDVFEGDEYRRDMLPVIVDGELHRAAAYLPLAALPAAAPEWSLPCWQQRHRQPMLTTERKVAGARRTRLRALRRH